MGKLSGKSAKTRRFLTCPYRMSTTWPDECGKQGLEGNPRKRIVKVKREKGVKEEGRLCNDPRIGDVEGNGMLGHHRQ